MPKHIVTLLLMISLGISILSSCSTTPSFTDHFTGAPTETKPSMAPPPPESLEINSAFWQGNPTSIWSRLQQVPLQKLQAVNTTDPTVSGWVKLAAISKRDSTNTTLLTQELIAWRTEYPSHPGNALFPGNSTLTGLQNTRVPQHIALLLPLQGPYGSQGKTVRDGFLNAYYSTLSSKHITQTVAFYDTSQTQNISSLYQKALGEGADFVVGPLTKDNVSSLASQGSINAPTLALNYSDLWFGSLPNNFYEFGLSPTDETQQVADKAHSAGYSRALIITTQDAWGQRVAKSISSRFQAAGGSVQEVLYLTPQTNFSTAIAGFLHVNPIQDNKKSAADNKAMLDQQRRRDFNVIFLLTPPQIARQVVPMLKYYYVDAPIYATSVVYSGTPSPERDSDLNGVIFSDTPWTLNTGGHGNRMYAVGLDAYTLTHEIPRMSALPNFPVYGQTGMLTLNSQHKIYRQLPWATIHDGRP